MASNPDPDTPSDSPPQGSEPVLPTTRTGNGERPLAEPAGGTPEIRPAGPDETSDAPDDWDGVDQASDESFPSSDPAPMTPGAD